MQTITETTLITIRVGKDLEVRMCRLDLQKEQRPLPLKVIPQGYARLELSSMEPYRQEVQEKLELNPWIIKNGLPD